MDGKHYEAAMNGNVSQLLGLLCKDANILDRLLFGGAAGENPLHMAIQLCERNLKLKTRICPRIKLTRKASRGTKKSSQKERKSHH